MAYTVDRDHWGGSWGESWGESWCKRDIPQGWFKVAQPLTSWHSIELTEKSNAIANLAIASWAIANVRYDLRLSEWNRVPGPNTDWTEV